MTQKQRPTDTKPPLTDEAIIHDMIHRLVKIEHSFNELTAQIQDLRIQVLNLREKTIYNG